MENKASSIQKLTAFWALCECGLGGVLHAFKIPITGLVVGAISITIIYFIAQLSTYKFSAIIHATLMVILVKFAVSPHSPIMAYLAVAFQGFIGAIIFQYLPLNYISTILIGVITMVESAVQKLIVLTVIFGNSLWHALDLYLTSILKSWQFLETFNHVWTILICYIILYAFWGVCIGILMVKLYTKVFNHSLEILQQYYNFQSTVSSHNFNLASPPKLRTKIALYLILLLLIVVYAYLVMPESIVYILIRSSIVIGLFYFGIGPLFKYLLKKKLAFSSQKYAQELNITLNHVNELRKHIVPVYAFANKGSNVFKKINTFLVVMLAIALFGKND